MPFLDTDILISFLRGKPNAIRVLNQLTDKQIILKTTSINVAELYFGVYLSSNILQNLKNLEDFLKLFRIYDFSSQDAKNFGEIQANLQKLGNQIGKMDVLIAAVVLAQNETLITHNIKHFSQVPLLKIQDWLPSRIKILKSKKEK